MQGTVKDFDNNKGYGYIVGDDGINYFIHFSAIQSKDITLDVGKRVEFTASDGRNGVSGKQANMVTILI